MGSEDVPRSGGEELSPEVERFLRPRPRPGFLTAVRSATAAGLVGWLAGVLVLAVYQQGGYGDFAIAARVIALNLTGSPDAVSGAPAMLVIMLSSAVIAAILGAFFGVIVARLIGRVGPVAAAGAGVTYGLLIWIVGQFVILSTLAPNAVTLTNQNAVIAAHVIYGLILGLLAGWSKEPHPRTNPLRLHRLWG